MNSKTCNYILEFKKILKCIDYLYLNMSII